MVNDYKNSNKNIMSYNYTLTRMTKISKKTDKIECYKRFGGTKTIIHCWWECKLL